MSAIVAFGSILASCLLASIAHELTHFVVAKLLGREATIVLGDWAVHYESAETVGVAEYAIAGAPVVIGTGAGVAVLLAGLSALWMLPAWYLYSLHGAITNDFAFAKVATA